MRPLPFIPLLLLSSAVLAVPFTPPPGGTPLLPPAAELELHLTNSPTYGEKKVVTISGASFDRALEVRTRRMPENYWDFQLAQKLPAAVRKGDVLWVSLWARAMEASSESAEGFSQIVIEQNSPPYDKLGLFDFSVGREWRQFAWTFTADRDYAAGAAQLCLRAGYSPQVLQLAGLQVLNYGQSVKPADLPRLEITYPGMEADAPWRKAAAERIERHRKADVRVTVSDLSGRPLSGATVRIEQQRHTFGFGSCVVAALIEGKGADHQRYREIIKNSYSKVVMENDLKWGMWEHSAADGHRTTLAALRWLRDQGVAVRGHNLVWPSWQFSPKSLAAHKNDPAALEGQIEAHIRDITSATKGLLTEWDVVNEPYSNHDVLDLLPPGSMATWFKVARETDPRPVLYLNDYAGFMRRGENTPHKDAFEKTLRELQAAGAPVGGLGIQAHFDNQFTGPEQLLKELDRWAALGLDIQITEFDLNTSDEQAQAQYTRDFMTAVFSHPAVSALLAWGFWERAHWKPQAAMYRADWSLRPNGQVWNDLVLKEWHTDVTVETAADGQANTRAFLGEYRVTVTHSGVEQTHPLTVTKDGATLSVKIP